MTYLGWQLKSWHTGEKNVGLIISNKTAECSQHGTALPTVLDGLILSCHLRYDYDQSDFHS